MKDLGFRIFKNDVMHYSSDYHPFYEFFEQPAHGYEDECDQYIGIEDKNGKSIYVGDIIEYFGRRIEIKWEQETRVTYGHGDSGHTRSIGIKFGYYGSEFKPDEIKVIGNIHQNPDLIAS